MIKTGLLHYLFFIYLFALGTGCQTGSNSQGEIYSVKTNGKIVYQLDQPDRRYTLPSSLQEISGLTYYKDNLLACVQDEKGEVYFLDTESGNITEKVDFGKNGDYEGLEYVNEYFYFLRSDGNLYKWKPGEEDADKIETPLKDENNVEGLGYLPSTGKLLLACKDKALLNGEKFRGRSIYQFDLAEEKLDPQPFILLDHDTVLANLQSRGLFVERHIPFRPSAIAVHPSDKDIYLLHSVGKLLIILSTEGKIKSMYPINPLLMEQPEGICFDPEGNLYIASESESDNGYLFLFRKRK